MDFRILRPITIVSIKIFEIQKPITIKSQNFHGSW